MTAMREMPGAVGLCPNHPEEFYVALDAGTTDEVCPSCGEWLEIFSRVGGVEQDGRSGRGQPSGGGAEPDADTGEGLLRSAKEGRRRTYQPARPSDCEHGYRAAGGTLACPACIPDAPWRVGETRWP